MTPKSAPITYTIARMCFCSQTRLSVFISFIHSK